MNIRKIHKPSKNRRFKEESLAYLDSLYRTALLMTQNSADAERLTHEIYLEVYRRWEWSGEGLDVRIRLFKEMASIFMNSRYTKPPIARIADVDDVKNDMLFSGVMSHAHAESTVNHFFNNIHEQDVRASIAGLTEDLRLIVILSFLEGFSYQEIAVIVGLSKATVRSKLYKGRRLLHKSLWRCAIRNGFFSKSPSSTGETPRESAAPLLSHTKTEMDSNNY
jgi:RNA polymerase sigma-70 factor (ECF subfamily)